MKRKKPKNFVYRECPGAERGASELRDVRLGDPA